MTASPNPPSEFDRFRDLARRTLTTPKAELVKPGDAKRVLAGKPGGKRKGKERK